MGSRWAVRPVRGSGDLQATEYDKRREIEALRRRAYEEPDADRAARLLNRLREAEDELSEFAKAQTGADPMDSSVTTGASAVDGLLVDTASDSRLLGKETTGLETSVSLRMAQVPTSIVHLWGAETFPLVTVKVTNTTSNTRRLRVTSVVDGYSAKAVETVEIRARTEHEFDQLPTFFAHAVRSFADITRASLAILVEDLDTDKVELNVSRPLWLLPATTAPLAILDPTTKVMRDMAPYLGAYVTPNAPPIQKFLANVYRHHPQHTLAGYQGEQTDIEPQVRAVYEALKADGGIQYVNSVISNSLQDGLASQRVRLPRESLEHHEANCIDGAVLFASLLEAVSLNPGIVLVPGHAFLAWETWGLSNEWRFVETTMLGSGEYDAAADRGRMTAERYAEAAKTGGRDSLFRVLSIRELRTARGIYPME